MRALAGGTRANHTRTREIYVVNVQTFSAVPGVFVRVRTERAVVLVLEQARTHAFGSN